MNKPPLKPKRPLWLIAAVVFFVLAAFFRFALIGYGFLSYTLFGTGLLIVLFHYLGRYGKNNPKRAKVLQSVLSAMIALVVLGFTALEIPIILSARTDVDCDAPYVIVLGAGLHGSTPSLSLLNRLSAAEEYLTTYPDSIAIVSGGRGDGEDITEAEAMETWLISRGIDPERIIKEENATSTYENLCYSLLIISEDGGDPNGKVAVVTSEYHLFRTKSMAEDLGASPLGVAAKTTLPVLRINYFIREAFAVAYMLAFQ